MKNKNTRRGFTLIELLVVVLIIGILAAVAVPQYQKAVWKSRFSEAILRTRDMAQALDLYELQHGRPSESINITPEDVDVDVFAGLVEREHGVLEYCSDYACYRLSVYNNDGGSINGAFYKNKNKDFGYVVVEFGYTQRTKERYCWYEDEFGEFLCSQAKALGWEDVSEGF